MVSHKIRLLIAEDEDAIRRSIINFIRGNTRRVDEIYEAGNGQEALDRIYQYRPQIMLLDIQMPVKDGFVVMKEAAAAGLCPRTIILSGYNEFEYARQAMRLGAADYLLKPCRSTEIIKKIEGIIRDEFSAPDTGEGREDGGADLSANRLVNAALAYMEDHYPEAVTLSLVADTIGITAAYLSTLFTHTAGRTFVDCLNRIRIDRACDYFADQRLKNYEVAYRVGFHDEKYFSSVFKKLKGMSPSEYRNTTQGGQG
ncbi:MAG: response regulator [Treponema sp.]|jgi:two-component system response regulator YesN|nr:response regulator [Treponema sp.]